MGIFLRAEYRCANLRIGEYMDDKRVIIIQQRQIARLTALAESLISAMDRQTDAIGRLVAIAMTPQEEEDIDPGKPAKPMYLSNED